MKEGQRRWTREELVLIMNLYCKTPFGKLHARNPNVISLAKLIGRSSNAVAFKLVNLASLDPYLKAKGIKGASNVSKLDKDIWNDFFDNWDVLPYESELLLAKYKKTSVEVLNDIAESEISKDGKTREQLVKLRVNQSFFRKSVLAAYNSTCCITGMAQPELLIAGHIKPWSIDEKNRLNPSNGIAINALHDKAFESGLLTIMPDFTIRISPTLFKEKNKPMIEECFLKYEKRPIFLPSKFLPSKEFLEYHNNNKFKCDT